MVKLKLGRTTKYPKTAKKNGRTYKYDSAHEWELSAHARAKKWRKVWSYAFVKKHKSGKFLVYVAE